MRVIYCDIDSLRADHTEPYGYARRVTPNLSRLAAEGVVYEHCYCSDSPCVPSRAALSSQQFGIVNGAIGNKGPAAQLRHIRAKGDRTEHVLLGAHLYRHGIYTASFSCFPERHQAYWFIGNFREWHKPSLSLGDDEDAQDVTAAVIAWLKQHGRQNNWFIHVNYWDPHIPYVEPSDWVARAADSGDPPPWPDEAAIEAHQQVYGPHSAVDLYEDNGDWDIPPPGSPNPDTMPDAIRARSDYEKMINGYDGAIFYWDHSFGQLLNALADLNILDETAIIVTSDHGEAFGENGVYGDHPLANEAIHHVPLIVRWPGLTDNLESAEQRCVAWLYSLDLGPTLCDLLDIPIPQQWHGKSFAPSLKGEEIQARTHLILSHGSYSYQRAVRTSDYLYIRTLHPGCFDVPWEQLYDMRVDPFMTANVLDKKEDIADRMRLLLNDWWYQHVGAPNAPEDPMQLRPYENPTDAFDYARYADRLRNTGREELARRLQQRTLSTGRSLQ